MPTAFHDISLPAGFYDAVVERYGPLFHVKPYITHHDRASLRRLLEEAGGTDVPVRASKGIGPFLAICGWRSADFLSGLEADPLENLKGLLFITEAGRAR